MEKIPVEVLGVICDNLDDRGTLKALRLVNRKFADIAARYLFKTLTVFQHLSSWRKIQRIADSPRLAHLVKKLEVVTVTLVNETRDFDVWKQRSQGHRVESHLRQGNRGAAVAELVEPLDDKLTVVLGLQRRCQTWLWWYDGQEVVKRIKACSESQGYPLSLSLPALGQVETTWPLDLWSPGPNPYRRGRKFNFGLRMGEYKMGDFFGPTNGCWNAHLGFALLVLNDNDLKITTLELHQSREILLNRMYPVPNLIYLKNLMLHFRRQTPEQYNHHMAMADANGKPEWILAPYLANAENLETLILMQDLSSDPHEARRVARSGYAWFDVIQILSTASWPKLRSLWFDAVFTNSFYLPQFLMMHGNTLRSVHLDRRVSDEVIWQLLASKFRTQCANPNCVISCSEDTIFRSNSAFVKESDLSHNEDDWPGFNPAGWWDSP